MDNRLEKLSHEDLVSEFWVVAGQVILYPKNKSYHKKLLMLEKELIRRLGGSWEEYCRINGWDTNK